MGGIRQRNRLGHHPWLVELIIMHTNVISDYVYIVTKKGTLTELLPYRL